jgi:predicted transcriptional regulator
MAEPMTRQQQLAAVTMIDHGFISRIDAGLVEPRLGTVATLGKAFEMSLSELLKGV